MCSHGFMWVSRPTDTVLGMLVGYTTGAGSCFLLTPHARGLARICVWQRDQNQGRQSPVYMSDRAFLMQARALCLGGERDELIVEAVCRLLQTTSKYKVSAGRKVDAGMVPSHGHKTKLFARSGRFSGRLPAEEASMVLEPNDFAALQGGGAAQRKTYLQKCARAAKPVELPDVAKKAVLNAISGQVVQPLPANINVLHALQRRGHKQRRTGQNRILVGFRGGY